MDAEAAKLIAGALAIGLAFGLGLKDQTPRFWQKIRSEWNRQR